MITTLNRTVSIEVERLLPSVLIGYLWDLASEDAFSQSHVFILKKQLLGGREMQEIWHIAGGEHKEALKVFGFDPVNASILIETQGDEVQMKSIGLLEAIRFVPGDVQDIYDLQADE